MPLIMPTTPSFFPTSLLRRRPVCLLLLSLTAVTALIALVASVILVLLREQHAVAGSDAGRSAAALLYSGNSVGGREATGSNGTNGSRGSAAPGSRRKQLDVGSSSQALGAAALLGEGNASSGGASGTGIAGGLPGGGLPEIWAQGSHQLNGSSGRGGTLRSARQEQLLRLIGEAKVTELKALCGRWVNGGRGD